MRVISGFDDVGDFVEEEAQVILVFILRSVEDYEANAFERFDFSLVFRLLAREEPALQANFIEVFIEEVAVFIVRDHPVDNLAPVAQCGFVAGEKVVLVEGFENIALEIFDEEQRGFLEEVRDEFRAGFQVEGVLAGFVVDDGVEGVNEFFDSHHHAILSFGRVGVLQEFKRESLQGF